MLKIIINSLYALKYRSLCHTRFALLPLTPDYQLLYSFFRHFSCYSLVFFIALYLLKLDFKLYLYESRILLLLDLIEAWMCRLFSIPFFVANTTITLVKTNYFSNKFQLWPFPSDMKNLWFTSTERYLTSVVLDNMQKIRIMVGNKSQNNMASS